MLGAFWLVLTYLKARLRVKTSDQQEETLSRTGLIWLMAEREEKGGQIESRHTSIGF